MDAITEKIQLLYFAYHNRSFSNILFKRYARISAAQKNCFYVEYLFTNGEELNEPVQSSLINPSAEKSL